VLFRSARAHLEANRARFGLTAADLTGMTVSDAYASRHNGVTHVYWLQRHAGIAVFNGIANVNVKADGSLVHIGSRFVPNLAGSVNATVPLVSASDAVRRAAEHLGLIAGSLAVARTIGGAEQAVVFTGDGFSRSEVPAKLTFYKTRLAWDVAIEPDSLHYWEVLVDAVTGAILFKYNHVQSDSYKVFAWPAESPNHLRPSQPKPPADGREVVTDAAANAVASPFGWHDLNGVAGADTVDTSGNNVNAQTDIDNNDQYIPTQDVRPISTTRDFLPPLDLSQFAPSYREAAVVNLFYWNNINHDLHYLYGFDEAAGNFQKIGRASCRERVSVYV
jgi:extracellular elastinolytic metalloproteinase